jgi:3-oxoacyl-[acyl-carrier protein] reductase
MNLDIKGKVVFITGSSRGIGLGITKILLEEDCKVIINGRNQERLNKTTNDLVNQYSGNILAVAGDVNEVAIIKKVKEKALERWGQLDGVVANAGAVKKIYEWDIPEKDWNWYFTNNFSVAYNAIQALVPLLTNSQGSIVTIGSIAGLEDVGAPLPYASSKAALLIYTKSLSRKLADKKIRVNMVSPGNILFPGGNWDKKQKSNPDNIHKMLQEKVPLEMFGSPEDIGNVVAFLLSSKARFITGTNIVVDGGQTNSMY